VSGNKILLITYFFPPLNNVSSLRTLSFARYLGFHGYQVTVLTVKHADHSSQELEAAKEPFQVVEVEMKEEKRGDERSEKLEDKGQNLSPSLLKKIKAWLLGNFFSSIDKWYFAGVSDAFYLMEKEHFDVVISSHSPISAHCIAWKLKRNFPETLWIADYRDLWSYNHFGITPKFPFSLVQRSIEKKINRLANYLTTVSSPLKETLDAHYLKNALVLENGFFPEDYELGKDIQIDFPAKYTFSYTGLLYMEKYDVTPFLKALAQLIDNDEMDADEGEVRFYGENSYLLQSQVSDSNLPVDFVHLLPQIPREEALAVQRLSKGLLFLGYESEETKGVLTGKLFEYMISGRPIVAVGITEANLAGQLIQKSNTGYVCGNDIKKIKEAISKIISGEGLEPNKEFIEKFSRDKLAKRLVGLIEQ